MSKCERCGATPSNPYQLYDYCANCSKNLCPKCMADGCCGAVPAVSGSQSDYPESGEEDDNGKENE